MYINLLGIKVQLQDTSLVVSGGLGLRNNGISPVRSAKLEAKRYLNYFLLKKNNFSNSVKFASPSLLVVSVLSNILEQHDFL